jgi:hypothetical protein
MIHMMNAPTTDIIAKIAKLLALADSANEHEARAAALAAARLMEKHRLDEATVAAASAAAGGPTGPVEPITIEHKPLYVSGKEIRWKTTLGAAIARHHGCKAWLSRGYGCFETADGGAASFALKIIGRASDVERVRALFAWLCLTAERLRGQQRSPSWGVTERKWRADYVYGFACGVAESLSTAKAQARAEAPTMGAAMVLVDRRDAEVGAALAAHFPRMKNVARAAIARTSAYHTGQRDGRNVHLGANIGAGSSRPALTK